MTTSRVIQNERGTWLAHWCGDPTENPPIEEREWLCLRCFNWIHEFASHIRVSNIDWGRVEQEIGKEYSEKLKRLLRTPVLQERVQQINELGLKKSISCKGCEKCLDNAAEALVEVY